MAKRGGLLSTLQRHQNAKGKGQKDAKVRGHIDAKVHKGQGTAKKLIGKKSSIKDVQSNVTSEWNPFSKEDNVLLVGEGDFSFSVSLLNNELVGNIVATSLDSESQLNAKYPTTIKANLQALESADSAIALFGVDGTQLEKCKYLKKKQRHFTCCVFNFPHIGNSIKDQDRNILQHQKLMLGFFSSSKGMINESNGRIIVTIFEGEPYVSWNIKKLAKSQGLTTLRSGKFDWTLFPEYDHKLTSKEGITSKPQKQRLARIYEFVGPHYVKNEKPIEDSESDID